MDRMVQTALSSITGLKDLKFDLANNLANANVPGFRRDLPNEGSAGFLSTMEQATARIFPLETGGRIFSSESGQLDSTGVETDIAMLNGSYLFIQPADGEVALSRRGDLGVDTQNRLVDGVGNLVLSDGLQPIVLPPFSAMKFSDNGEVLVRQPGAMSGEFISVGFLGSTSALSGDLTKSLDGKIRKLDGSVPDPDQTGLFAQGVLEGSNVNAIEEMVFNMDMQRQFEINVKLIKQAEEIDKAGTKLMSLPT
jgi:flagellar basal-body rod protein FlgF